MITEDYWRCCKIIVNQVASVISTAGLQSSLKMNPIWVVGLNFFPSLLLLYKAVEIDTVSWIFMQKAELQSTVLTASFLCEDQD